MLDEDGSAYLADFGIAKNLGGANGGGQTTGEVVIGSPAYISPEQIMAEPVKPQTDIYSLGVMLYELLTGRKPFKGPTPVAYIQQHLGEQLPLLVAAQDGDADNGKQAIPTPISIGVGRATAKDPGERYPDILSMLADLRQARQPDSTVADVTDSRAETTTPAHIAAMIDLPDMENPYKGLRAFGEADAADFFGRDTLVQALLIRMAEESDVSRFLAVVGPSGSGKSSVVKAGLMPALRQGGLPDSEKWFIRSVAFSPDGQILASGSEDGTIILWDLSTQQPIGPPLTGDEVAVRSVTFSPDGKILASGYVDGSIILWEVASGQRVDPSLAGHATAAVRSLAFSPDGQLLASGSRDDTIILWDVATGQPLGSPLTGHTDNVMSVAFSPDGQTLASGSQDGTIILWDVATGQPLGPPLTGHTSNVNSVAFSPDGDTLASGSKDHTIILWDVSTGEALGPPLTGHEHPVRGVSFSPDGQLLASASDDHTIILWDVATSQAIGLPLTGHTHWVVNAVFSPDGKTLVSGSADETIRLWDVDLESWRARACRRANRNLTLDEWQQFFGDQPYKATCPRLPVPEE